MFASRTNWNFAANRLALALAEHRASGKPLLDLTASNPTACGFLYDSGAILRALANPAALEYHPDAKGLAAARQPIAAYYSGRGDHISPDDIILTSSTSEAYSFVFRLLCNPGDELLIPEPSYPLFAFLAELHDLKLAPYSLLYDNGWHIDFHALKSVITARTRVIIVVNPNNPTGNFIRDAERAALNKICAERSLAIIADEVFLDFALSPNAAPRSFATNSAALTFTLSGLSKIAGLPQMKLAWLIASGPQQPKFDALQRLELISDTYLSVGTPVQCAAADLLATRVAFQSRLLARAQQNLAELDRQLAQQKSCERLAVEAGWYAVLRVPVTRSSEDLAIALLAEHSVYVHPGHFYDFSSEGYLVVSLITPPQDFAAGIRVIIHMF